MWRLLEGSFRICCPEPVKPTAHGLARLKRVEDSHNVPLAFTPSGVRNMLSFFATLPVLPFEEKSCHLLFPASSSLLALTFRGTLAGLVGPSLTLLGSFLAWLARSGFMSAAADITFDLAGNAGVVGVPGVPSALRFLESVEIGLMSWADNVSVFEYDLKVTW